MKRNNFIGLFFLLLIVGLQSCRKDKMPLSAEEQYVTTADPKAFPRGMYVLNEGNMNDNKASLDFMDFTTGVYKSNIYESINPEVTMGLGDVGNDIAIYGSKMYAVVNVSNKIEVLNAKTGKRIKQIDLINGRYITFYQGKAYVSGYLGKVADSNAPQGIVAEIDTTSLTITRKVEVGRQPEELAVINGKLYVANSGGYTPSNYESTVSVVDISTFKELKRIAVAINLHRLKADTYGDLYVSSRGDYFDIKPKLFVIDTQTDQVKKSFNIGVSDMVIHGDLAYIVGTDWSSANGSNSINYRVLNVKDETLQEGSFITDGTQAKIELPYGVSINPETGDIIVSDAKIYSNPGTVYCFNPAGKLKWSAVTGDIPGHFAFLY